MKELTDKQIKLQDFVDNKVFELIQCLDPSGRQIDWNIEMIGDVRECIKHWLVDDLKVCDEMSFYPYIEE